MGCWRPRRMLTHSQRQPVTISSVCVHVPTLPSDFSAQDLPARPPRCLQTSPFLLWVPCSVRSHNPLPPLKKLTLRPSRSLPCLFCCAVFLRDSRREPGPASFWKDSRKHSLTCPCTAGRQPCGQVTRLPYVA